MFKRIITGLLIVALSVGAVFALRHLKRPAKIAALPLSLEKMKGPVDALVKIEVFSDFECPACRAAVAEEQKLLTQYPGKIRIVYYHFPLSAHRLSPLAHLCAECAARQNRFWTFHDKLYGEQSHWAILANPLEVFLRFVRDEGLDLNLFSACLRDEAVRKRIMDEKQYGTSLQVNSTPTFFINGERFIGSLELNQGGTALIRKILGDPVEPVKPE